MSAEHEPAANHQVAAERSDKANRSIGEPNGRLRIDLVGFKIRMGWAECLKLLRERQQVAECSAAELAGRQIQHKQRMARSRPERSYRARPAGNRLRAHQSEQINLLILGDAECQQATGRRRPVSRRNANQPLPRN